MAFFFFFNCSLLLLGTGTILLHFFNHSKLFVTVLNSLTFYSKFLGAYLGVDLNLFLSRLCFWAPSQLCTPSCWNSLMSGKWPTWYRTPWAVCRPSCMWMTPYRPWSCSASAKPWRASCIPIQVRWWVSWMKHVLKSHCLPLVIIGQQKQLERGSRKFLSQKHCVFG